MTEIDHGKGRPETGGLVTAGGLPQGSDAAALRERALHHIRSGDPQQFRLAERALVEAIDLPDPDGRTHHLLGLVQFLQQDYATAAVTLETAIRASPGQVDWEILLERSRRNALTGLAKSPAPTEEFDVAALTTAPSTYLREPVDIKPLPKERWGLRLRGTSRELAGAVASPIVGAVLRYETRHGIPQAWIEWPELKAGDIRKDLKIGGIRNWMNANTLQSTEAPGTLVDGQAPGQSKPWFADRFPTADGSWTTDDPREGAAGTRVAWQGKDPVAQVRRDRSGDPDLPSVREVSRAFLACSGEQKRAPFLNQLAIAWIQFMLEGWIRHRQSELTSEDPIRVELAADDPLRVRYGQDALVFRRTQRDVAPTPGMQTYRNESAAWWRGNQLYGNDQATQDLLRTDPQRPGAFLPEGKMFLPDGMLPTDADGRELSGSTQNWWIGRSVLHTLFVMNHNRICDLLQSGVDPSTGTRYGPGHPDWSTDQLFHTARLINGHVMAKIHTVEWTPAVLPTKELAVGMSTNWNGLLDALLVPFSRRRVANGFDVTNPVLGGLVDGRRESFGVPYNFGEQFAEVYRLHAGVPQEISIRPIGHSGDAETVPTDAAREQGAQQLMHTYGLATMLNSLAHEKMTLLVNNNYPPMFTEMSVEGLPVMDLGAADVLRARERGVPAYNEFRRQIGLPPIERFEDLEADPETTKRLVEVYGEGSEGVERLDLIVGTLCEGNRPLHGFGQTLFAVFVQFASGRLQRDPWFSKDKFNERYLTIEGVRFIDDANLRDTILALCPEFAETNLGKLDDDGEPLVYNAFEPISSTWRSAPDEHPLKSTGAEKY
jgi:hypothetical protein